MFFVFCFFHLAPLDKTQFLDLMAVWIVETTQSQVLLSIIVTDLGFYSDYLKSINIQGDHDLKFSFWFIETSVVCVRVQNVIFWGRDNVILCQLFPCFLFLLRHQYHRAFEIKNLFMEHQRPNKRFFFWYLFSSDLLILLLITSL